MADEVRQTSERYTSAHRPVIVSRSEVVVGVTKSDRSPRMVCT